MHQKEEPFWLRQIKIMGHHATEERKNGNIPKAISILKAASTISKNNKDYDLSDAIMFRCAMYLNLYAAQLISEGNIIAAARVYGDEVKLLVEIDKPKMAQKKIVDTIKLLSATAIALAGEGTEKERTLPLYEEALRIATEYKASGYIKMFRSYVDGIRTELDNAVREEEELAKRYSVEVGSGARLAEELEGKQEYEDASKIFKALARICGEQKDEKAASEMWNDAGRNMRKVAFQSEASGKMGVAILWYGRAAYAYENAGNEELALSTNIRQEMLRGELRG